MSSTAKAKVTRFLREKTGETVNLQQIADATGLSISSVIRATQPANVRDELVRIADGL